MADGFNCEKQFLLVKVQIDRLSPQFVLYLFGLVRRYDKFLYQFWFISEPKPLYPLNGVIQTNLSIVMQVIDDAAKCRSYQRLPNVNNFYFFFIRKLAILFTKLFIYILYSTRTIRICGSHRR